MIKLSHFKLSDFKPKDAIRKYSTWYMICPVLSVGASLTIKVWNRRHPCIAMEFFITPFKIWKNK